MRSDLRNWPATARVMVILALLGSLLLAPLARAGAGRACGQPQPGKTLTCPACCGTAATAMPCCALSERAPSRSQPQPWSDDRGGSPRQHLLTALAPTALPLFWFAPLDTRVALPRPQTGAVGSRALPPAVSCIWLI